MQWRNLKCKLNIRKRNDWGLTSGQNLWLMVYCRNRSIGVNGEPSEQISWVIRLRYLIVLLFFFKNTELLHVHFIHVINYPTVVIGAVGWAISIVGWCLFQAVWLWGRASGFGGLEVTCLTLVPKFAIWNPDEDVGFLGRKNPLCAFLREGSKAVGPLSNGM